MKLLGVGLGLVSELVVASLLGFYAGQWLGREYELGKNAGVIGLIFMLTISIVHVIRALQRISESMEDKKEKQS